MMYLNTTLKEIEEEYKIIAEEEDITINISAKKFHNILKDTIGQVWFKFKTMTVEDFWFIDKYAKSDSEEFKKLILKYQVLDCNLDIKLEFTNNILTDESWEKLLELPAPLIDAFVEKYQETYLIDDDEAKKIERQSAILFSPNSRGVDDACEAITLFCVLGNFWEKFGINRFDLKKLSYKEYVQLRAVLSREIDRTKAQQNRQKNKAKTRIAGPGGRTRPSQGITIEG